MVASDQGHKPENAEDGGKAAVVAVVAVLVWMVLRRIIGLRSLAGQCGRSCAAGRRSLMTLVLVG